MSRDRVVGDRFVNRGESPYIAPEAEWHDLRMITLGGSAGNNDSGNPENQQEPVVRHYDSDGEDFDNYA